MINGKIGVMKSRISYFPIFFIETGLLFFLFVKTDLVYFPLDNIEFLKVVLHPHKLIYGLCAVWNWLGHASIAIREIRPAILGCIRVIMNNEIITKTWSVILMKP